MISAGGSPLVRGKYLVIVALVALPLGVLAEDQPPAKEAPPKDAGRVRLELRNAPLASVLRALCERKGRTLVLREEVPERVSLSFSDMTVDDAFDQLIALHGYRKEEDGDKTIVTRRVADVTSGTVSDDPVGRLYPLVRLRPDFAVAALESVTAGKAAFDILPGAELLVVARPSVHEGVRAWLADADRARQDGRLFRLFNRTISGVDSATAVTHDPIAREVGRMLSPLGVLEVDLARNALIVRDESLVLERVARRIAVLDRAPLPVTVEIAALQVEPGTHLPGFAPTNDLPHGFAAEGNGGIMACFPSESSTFDEFIRAFTNHPTELDIAELRGRTKEKTDERKTITLGLDHRMPSGIAITPRIVPGGVELEIRAGTAETRVRVPNARPVAIRGLVKTDHWTGGWSSERRELVLLVQAQAELQPPKAPRDAPAPRERTPELALPDDWAKASSGR